MNLGNATKYQIYTVKNITSLDEEMTSRFYKLGIFPGVDIVLKRRAPLFKDPLLFDVEGSQIALTLAEANLLDVTEKAGK